MPFIRIFDVPLIFHYLVCDRYSADRVELIRYQLGYGELKCWLSPSDARYLGGAAERLEDRRRVADKRRTSMRPGPVFRRWLPVVDGNTKVPFEIGVTDGGDATYFEADDLYAQLGCREEELRSALDLLRDDVSEIRTASEPPPRPYAPGHDYVLKWMRHWN